MNLRPTAQLRHSLFEIVEKLKVYEPNVDRNLLERVMRWSADRLKLRGMTSESDEFSDPYTLAEKLIDVAKADQDTIITAIIYPALRSHRGSPVDTEGLEKIGELFKDDKDPLHGRTIRRMVKHTLRMLSQEQLPLRPGARQDLETQNREFRLMNLWIGLDPRVILIRSVQRLMSLENLSERQGSRNFYETIDTARNVIAHLAYIANYGKVRQLILEKCFQLEDPTKYTAYRQGLASDGHRRITDDDLIEIKHKNPALYNRLKKEFRKEGERKITDEDLALLRREHRSLVVGIRRELAGGKSVRMTTDDLQGFKDQLTEHLTRQTGLVEEVFDIEIDAKTADATNAKTKRKSQELHQIGDRFRFRIILKEEALKFLKLKEPSHEEIVRRIDSQEFEKAHPEESDEERELRLEKRIEYETKIVKLGKANKAVYASLCKQFGRGNKVNPDYGDEFARIVREDPSPDNPAKDDRFDNYIDKEKPSGYSAMQDTFCFYHSSGILVELEGQIVDEIRHERNTFGPRSGHVFYKTGTSGRHDIVMTWFKAARDVMEGREHSDRVGTFVYNELNEIHLITPTNGRRATIRDYIVQTYDQASVEAFAGARIQNKDPFAERPPNHIYRNINVPLENGDRLSMI